MRQVEHLLAQAQAAWRTCHWEAAQGAYLSLLEQNPTCFAAHNGLGVLYRELGNYVLSHGHLKQAVTLEPHNSAAWGNWGRLAADQGDTITALNCYEKAASFTTDSRIQAQLNLNRALVLLRAGHWQAGWSAYAHWALTEPGEPLLQGPRWQGQSLPEQTLWVDAHTHCGYGDILMFSRYLTQLVQAGVTVNVVCPEALVPLLQTVEGLGHVLSQCPEAVFDPWVPLYLLPYYLSTSLDDIPEPTALYADNPSSIADGGRKAILNNQPLTIAINGGCHPQSRSHVRRYCPLTVWQSLQEVAGCHWISLQTEISPQEQQLLQQWPHMQAVGYQLHHFSDTVAWLQQADLVITVDSVIAHLAGTLGKPVWVLLAYAADWRWLQQRSDSPWYPSARLWRQPQPGDWVGVLEAVKRELDN